MDALAEILRRLDNLIMPGTIAEVDHQAARCRVRIGELTTAPLRWFSLRAGTTSDWSPPSDGEQCVVFSPGGEPAAGFVLVGLYSDDNPPPSDSATNSSRRYPDGAVITYDHQSHALTATLPADGKVIVQAPAGFQLVGDLDVTGTLTASVDVVAAGVSLVEHPHGGVQPGTGQSDRPVPT